MLLRVCGLLPLVRGQSAIVAVTPAGYIVGVIVYAAQPRQPGKTYDTVFVYGKGVSPIWRRNGIGERLMQKLAEIYPPPNWKIALSAQNPEDPSVDLRPYYRKRGFGTDSENENWMSRRV